MRIEEIPDLKLWLMFNEIAKMADGELAELGLNAVIRDRLLDGIILPNEPDGCWLWAGAHLGKGNKARAVIHYRGRVLLVYRVAMALLIKKNIEDELLQIHHKCPVRENCRCVCPKHLKEADSRESAARENARDRSVYGTLNGDHNGSRKHPESRPRGFENPKSQFKGPDGAKIIQMLRATYDAAAEKRGMVGFLVRFSGKSRCAVSNVVLRRCYNEVPDDPSAALDPSLIKVTLPGDSAKRRKVWPAGDSHRGARMPMAAKREFVILFHRTPRRAQKRLLVEYVAARYGIEYSSVQSLAYEDPAIVGAPQKSEIVQMPKIDVVTPELLESTFGNMPALGRKGREV